MPLWLPSHPVRHLPSRIRSVLDMGCNIGALLSHIRQLRPGIAAFGVDINSEALRRANETEIVCQSASSSLPFVDGSFECVTCIQVLEHIPRKERQATLEEIHRVLRPGGRLILSTPHAGWTAWADPNNLRFRLPYLHKKLLRQGLRDAGYGGQREVIWHHHFTVPELSELLASRPWRLEYRFRSGILAPFLDALGWPFYRYNKTSSLLLRQIHRLLDWDLSLNAGAAGYNVLLAATKMDPGEGICAGSLGAAD